MVFLIKEMNLTTSFLVLLFLSHRSLVKNKKETAVINILNLRTFRMLLYIHFKNKRITKVRRLESRLSKYLTVNYKKEF